MKHALVEMIEITTGESNGSQGFAIGKTLAKDKTSILTPNI